MVIIDQNFRVLPLDVDDVFLLAKNCVGAKIHKLQQVVHEIPPPAKQGALGQGHLDLELFTEQS